MKTANIVIKTENLGKCYRIGRSQSESTSIAQSLGRWLGAPFAYLRSRLRPPTEVELLWALQNVSVSVPQGQILGIIGHNGAGKSTLLKILTRVTGPTTGQATIRGRVGSLLEVGTGFHPELTGRENVFLNGAFLGMRQAEIHRKFDEIVAFAGVEKFLDTPVKRYSSGMYVRLAFAVAAHLDTEVLLVDEVLSVGDAAFQKKCLGKMSDVTTGQGKTVLFVSHNMVAVQNLCDRVIWLSHGQIVADDAPDVVVSQYLNEATVAQTEQVWADLETAPGNDKVRLHRVSVRPEDGCSSDPITMQTPLLLEFEFWNLVAGARLNLNFHLLTEQGIVAFASASINDEGWYGRLFPTGLFRSVCRIPPNLLNTGVYSVNLRVVQDSRYFIYQSENCLVFDVQDAPERRGEWYGKRNGVVRPLLEWTTRLIEANEQSYVESV